MPECAFCDHIGKLSNEHIISDWIEPLFNRNMNVRYVGKDGKETYRKTQTLDYKAKVVCEKCNNTWMSRIETDHAKPSLTPLILGEVDIPIPPEVARSIAVFAFKTAVILDCSTREREPFFSRRLRTAFRQHLFIPNNVHMWICGYSGHRGNGHLKSVYHSGETDSHGSFQLYVCTFAIGNFAIQVVAIKQSSTFFCKPMPGFERLAVPLWPNVPKNFIWPMRSVLRTRDEFDRFSDRWAAIDIFD